MQRLLDKGIPAPFSGKNLILPFSIFSFYLTQYFLGWPMLRFWNVANNGKFEDLVGLIAVSNCYEEEGMNVYTKGETFCHNFFYGRFTLWLLSSLNFGDSFAIPIGFIFLATLSMILAKYFESTLFANFDKPNAILFSSCIVVSPPLQLLAERANLDILMFLLIYSSAHLLHKTSRFALITIGFATLLKFYTLPLYLIIFFRNTYSIKFRLFCFGMFLSHCYWVYFELNFISSYKNFYEVSTSGVFHWQSAITFINNTVSINLTNIETFRINLMFHLILLYLVHILSKTLNLNLSAYPNSKSRFLFYVFALIFLVSYFSSAGADYRLFLPLSAALALLSLYNTPSIIKTFLIEIVILALWLSYPSGGLEIVGDLLCSFLAVLFLRVLLDRRLWELKNVY